MKITFHQQAICIRKLKKVRTAMIYEDYLDYFIVGSDIDESEGTC